MKITNAILLFGLLLTLPACRYNPQSTNAMTTTEKNFSCDLETGVCRPSAGGEIEELDLNQTKKVTLVYYTDPICSACWAIEPMLKKFKLEYGDYVDVEYKMGGLLPGWEGFADKANGISKPSDVAHHWDEVGRHTGMSIDGDVWLEDPLDSSFPPSIAFKAAQKQGEAFALDFLREIRENVFLEKKNITREEILVAAVEKRGGDTARFLTDYRDEATERLFVEEMNAGRNYGVRGFPTFIFVNEEGKGFKISGMSGYENYVRALTNALGREVMPKPIHYDEAALLEKYGFLATKEIAFVLSQTEEVTLEHLNSLAAAGKVTREPQKFSDFWRFRANN